MSQNLLPNTIDPDVAQLENSEFDLHSAAGYPLPSSPSSFENQSYFGEDGSSASPRMTPTSTENIIDTPAAPSSSTSSEYLSAPLPSVRFVDIADGEERLNGADFSVRLFLVVALMIAIEI